MTTFRITALFSLIALSAACDEGYAADDSSVYADESTADGQPIDPVCDWSSGLTCVQVVSATMGTRCGEDSSVEVQVRNVCTTPVKIQSCIERSNGKWSCLPDGTFGDGLAPGAEANWYVCDGTGTYVLGAMRIDAFEFGECHYWDVPPGA
ncbi:MAG: hypothetical protein ACI9MC_000726 [Kiritimatiellia bacterium]|jgi:hypothetical protein